MTTATKTLTQLLEAAGSCWAPLAAGNSTWEDHDNSAVQWLLDRYDDCPDDLCNYELSDFVNLDMPYTYDLLKFYQQHEDGVKGLFDEWMGAIGATSTLEALEGQTIEDPEDMMTAMVNLGMTYAAGMIWDDIRREV